MFVKQRGKIILTTNFVISFSSLKLSYNICAEYVTVPWVCTSPLC